MSENNEDNQKKTTSITGIEVSDILGLSQPITKFIDVISKGLGKFFEPIYTKRMAKAKTYEINQISEEINKNLILPIKYSNGDIIVDTFNTEDLLKRAGNRFIYQEIKKQLNIDSIVEVAYNELKDKIQISSEQVDDDWIIRFFNSIEDVSNEGMQKIWGKILAGEIIQPRTYSLRTLEKLKCISMEEALLFQQICNFIIISGNTYGVINNDEFKDIKTCYNLENIIRMDECGLISSDHDLKFILEYNYGKEIDNIQNKNMVCIIKQKLFLPKKENIISIPMYIFTSVGIQLYKIMNDISNNNDYIITLFKYCKQVIINYDVSAYRIIDGEISYDKNIDL